MATCLPTPVLPWPGAPRLAAQTQFIQPGIFQNVTGLRYAEFSPDTHAAELIDCFYWLENTAHTPLDYPVIADASADLLLDMNGVMRGAISSTLQTPIPMTVPPGTCVFGIRLQAGGLQRLPTLCRQAREGSLQFLASTSAPWLERRRRESLPLQMERLQDGLLKVARPRSADAVYAAEQLSRIDTRLSGTGAPLSRLANEMTLSPRQLHRLSVSHLGLSPTVFLRVCRVQAALSRLASQADLPLAALAAETGFSDQAHLTREVGRLTGLTPARWRVRFIQYGSARSPHA